MSDHPASEVVDPPAIVDDPDDLTAGRGDRSPRLWIALAIVGVIAVAAGVFLFVRQEGAAPRGSGTVINGGDLGQQSDAMALSQRLGPELAERESPGASVAPGSVPCGDSEAALPVDQAELVYSARLEWEGTPAVVLGYRVEGPSLARLLLVLAEADCRLIVTQSF